MADAQRDNLHGNSFTYLLFCMFYLFIILHVLLIYYFACFTYLLFCMGTILLIHFSVVADAQRDNLHGNSFTYLLFCMFYLFIILHVLLIYYFAWEQFYLFTFQIDTELMALIPIGKPMMPHVTRAFLQPAFPEPVHASMSFSALT